MLREVNLTDKAFQSDEAGKIITSKRKFGVEFEVFCKTEQAIDLLAKEIAPSFGFHHDGSIKGSGVGVEIVTPIMSGKTGEDCINDLLKKMDALKYETNLTCGLHVHHDATEFMPTNNIKKSYIEAAKTTNTGGIRVIIQDKLYAFLSNKLIDNTIFKKLNAVRKEYIDDSGLFFVNLTINNIEVRVYGIQNYYFLADSKAVKIYKKQSYEFDVLLKIINKSDIVLQADYGRLDVIKGIMYAYTVFDDVFMSMVPDDRRENNRFCKKISTRVAPFEIERCGNISDVEKLWFREGTREGLFHKKKDKYDESRYYATNFHSLFAKYNTVEIRLHEGTLNPTVVLYWIAFHQHIIDHIASVSVDINSCKRVLDIFRLEDKTSYFFDLFKFPSPIEKYVKHRIQFFTNNNNNN